MKASPLYERIHYISIIENIDVHHIKKGDYDTLSGLSTIIIESFYSFRLLLSREYDTFLQAKGSGAYSRGDKRQEKTAERGSAQDTRMEVDTVAGIEAIRIRKDKSK